LDLHEKFTRVVFLDKEELIKFRKSSTSGSGSRNFMKDPPAFQDRALFSSLAYISRKAIGSSWKFLS